MMAGLWQVIPWVQALSAAARDTVLIRQVNPDPGWFGKVTGVASGLVSLALLILTAFLVPAAWNFRKSYNKVNELLKAIQADIQPITRHASAIADNIDYISTAVRTDMQQVHLTIQSANERLNEALAISEKRVREFNALLRVVQEEAEDTFVSTASTLRGVRVGATVFQEGVTTPSGLDPDLEDEETDDGYDRTLPPSDREPGPRIRPRPRAG